MLNSRVLATVMSTGLACSGLAAVNVAVAGTAMAAPAVSTCNVFFDVSKDKHDDLAVGTPGERVTGAENAGTVTLVYGDGDGALGYSDGRSLSQADVGLTPEKGDLFGAAVLTADLNGDGCGDLVIGSPGQNKGAGIVVVVYGKAPGAGQFGDNVQVLKQGSKGVPGSSEGGDGFGSSLAVTGGNVDDGGGKPTQLWVGVPGEDIGKVKDAGLAVIFPTTTSGLLKPAQAWSRHQGTGGVSGSAESGDRFAATLAGSATTMLVGVPGEDVGSTKNAGLVNAFVNGTPSTWTRKTAGVPGTIAAGDQFGASLAIMPSCDGTSDAWAIGAPLDNITGHVDAGSVTLLDRGTKTGKFLRQGTNGIPGGPEKADKFGSALVGTGVSADRAKPYLAIGTPGEDLGSTKNTGSVTTLTTTCSGGALATANVTNWSQSSDGLPGKNTSGDHFGAALGASLVLQGTPATGTLDYRLVISLPDKTESSVDGPLVRSGMVMVLPAAANGFTATGSTAFGQNTDVDGNQIPGIGETGDRFGSALDAANAGH